MERKVVGKVSIGQNEDEVPSPEGGGGVRGTYSFSILHKHGLFQIIVNLFAKI